MTEKQEQALKMLPVAGNPQYRMPKKPYNLFHGNLNRLNRLSLTKVLRGPGAVFQKSPLAAGGEKRRIP